MILKPGYVLFCESEDDDEAINNARLYCAGNGYDNDEVKITRREGMICVITKKEIKWPLKKQT